MTDLTTEEDDGRQSTPAMYAVEIRIAHMVVEVKHSLNTPDCDSKRH